jgi:hypothetical protein
LQNKDKMKSINVVGDINPEIWERQRLSHHESEYIFNYKNFSSNASWTIHIGNANIEFQPNFNSKNLFMLVEPPEIYRYKSGDLGRFDIVSGPKFPEYINLPNYCFSQVALPWSAGVAYPEINAILRMRILRKILKNLVVFAQKSPQINFSIDELLQLPLPKEKFLSIVTSNKVETPMQKKRLDFIKFLSSRKAIPIEIYGRGFKKVDDKFEILRRSSHHLALENSSYDGYWTEKLADPILSLNRTYYSGATDVQNYFPSNIVLPIDLSDFDSAANIIERDFINFEYDLNSLKEARDILVNENSFESIVSKIIQTYETNMLSGQNDFL